MENVKTKKKVWPLAVAITALVLVAAAVLCWIFWPRPLVTAQALVAADLETAPINFCLLGKFLYFFCNHCKSFSVLAGSRCLYCCI